MNKVDEWIVVFIAVACIAIALACIKGCEYTENTNQSAIEHGLVPKDWQQRR